MAALTRGRTSTMPTIATSDGGEHLRRHRAGSDRPRRRRRRGSRRRRTGRRRRSGAARRRGAPRRRRSMRWPSRYLPTTRNSTRCRSGREFDLARQVGACAGIGERPVGDRDGVDEVGGAGVNASCSSAGARMTRRATAGPLAHLGLGLGPADRARAPRCTASSDAGRRRRRRRRPRRRRGRCRRATSSTPPRWRTAASGRTAASSVVERGRERGAAPTPRPRRRGRRRPGP